MLNATTAALCLLLFLLLFASAHFGISVLWDRLSLMRRLAGRRAAGSAVESGRFRFARAGKVYVHIADLLSAVGWKVKPGSFFAASLFLGLAGTSGGMVLFQAPLSMLLLGLMLGLLPYALLRMRLVSKQMATQLDFLPAVELFYQCYLVTGKRHIRTALQKTVEERRLPGEVQAAFDQLSRNLSVGEDPDICVRRFCLAFGHAWSDYFGSILRIALSEGNNVTANLKELISDMRKAQLASQQERHRLLEIRLANFTPALFLALFLGINFRMNPDASYQAYVLDPEGRGMLLNALVLLFGSLLMGLYLSRRKL